MPEEQKPNTPAPESQGTTFTQEQVDSMIQNRVARIKEQFPDYDELKQFKTQHQKDLEARTQKDLEAQQKYEEAQKGNIDKIANLETIINNLKAENTGIKVDHTLTTEIGNQGGFVEESLALLKSQVKLGEDGAVTINGKDSNGQNTLLSVAEGVKQFLENKPHLVKAAQRGGAGTTSSPDGQVASTGVDDLSSLNIQYAQAINNRDAKAALELKTKIQTILATKGQNTVGV